MSGSASLHWHFEPMVLVPLAIVSALYATGVIRLWNSAGIGHGIGWRHVIAFAAALLLAIVALVSPLAHLSESMFSAHMVGHEILMIAVAPLIAVSMPVAAFAWAFPDVTIATRRWKAVASRVFQVIGSPLPATLLQAATLWLWHVPAFFRAATEHESLHTLQHITFLASALLFWHAMHRIGKAHAGAALGYLFLTSLHTNFLGALITLSPTVIFPAGGGLGLTPLDDQQLGGAIMWVPGGMVYVGAALVVAARWIAHDVPRRQTSSSTGFEANH